MSLWIHRVKCELHLSQLERLPVTSVGPGFHTWMLQPVCSSGWSCGQTALLGQKRSCLKDTQARLKLCVSLCFLLLFSFLVQGLTPRGMKSSSSTLTSLRSHWSVLWWKTLMCQPKMTLLGSIPCPSPAYSKVRSRVGSRAWSGLPRLPGPGALQRLGRPRLSTVTMGPFPLSVAAFVVFTSVFEADLPRPGSLGFHSLPMLGFRVQ